MKPCTYPGCPATTDPPASDGWTWFEDSAPGLPDGFYYPAHSAAIEAVIREGGLHDPDNEYRHHKATPDGDGIRRAAPRF
jgi:hypothetical protein